MADNSKIEWTEATLNVVTGCTKVSEGCLNCYIPTTMPFRTTGRRFDKPGIGGKTSIELHPSRLTLPLKWRTPKRIFVNSLSDLFHEDIPDGMIAALWLVMGQSAGCIPEQYRGHDFQILTKRPARMRAFLRKWADVGDRAIPPMDKAALRCGRAELVEAAAEYLGGPMMYDWMDGPRYWPTALPRVWLGVSAENQKWADVRIPILRDCPAEVRFVSAEPLLGPWSGVDLFGIHWIIVGGESGKGARSMEAAWAQSVVDLCDAQGVRPFVKQMGSAWARDMTVGGQAVYRSDPKGGNWDHWPANLRRREYPTVGQWAAVPA